MVMPRSRSRSIRSRYCSRICRSDTAWVSSRIRSASVDLPWSMCATMQKLRMRDWLDMRRGSLAPRVRPGSGRGIGEGRDDRVAARGLEGHLVQGDHHATALRDLAVLPDETGF